MSNSFQNELPKARVNITLNVDKQSATQKKELPLKLLMLGDYSHGQSSQDVASRQRVNIDKNTFDQVMAYFSPKLRTRVVNQISSQPDLLIDLTFKKRQDFSPDEIAKSIPALRRLLAMRNLLKDLKVNALDDTNLRKSLVTLIKDKQALKLLKSKLEKSMPIQLEGEQDEL